MLRYFVTQIPYKDQDLALFIKIFALIMRIVFEVQILVVLQNLTVTPHIFAAA